MIGLMDCYCAGCVGMGPCDDGTSCAYGCGGHASNVWGTCGRCEDEVTGQNEVGDGWDEEHG